MTDTITYDRDADGIVVLTLDDPGQSANTMNAAFQADLGRIVDRLEAELDAITGVVLTSAKRTFFAGGDLDDLLAVTVDDAEEFTASINAVKDRLRRLETLGRPVVAAMGGSALGGGLEIALATHHRIALDAPGVVFGLPEATLGLLPGAGGIVRTTRMLGVRRALDEVLFPGRRYPAAQAAQVGLVDELVAEPSELLPRAKAWIAAHPDARQPWDAPGFRLPGDPLTDPEIAALAANVRKRTRGAPAPAQRAILAAAVEGAAVDVATAAAIETRYFVPLVTGQIAKNMTKATFRDLKSITAGGSRPDGYPTYRARKVGVLGAGMMGAAIAYVAARAGIDVVLKDVSVEAAEKGKGYAVGLERRAVERGATTAEASAALLARITATADPADFAGVDLVIEAVFESPELKQRVFGEIEHIVASDAVLGSNTSTLPITGLAEGVGRPEDFIGIHFFSPVDKLPLVEIICGEQTSDATLAKVFDFVLQIGKTPIVVGDSRGFFTSRVISTFLAEAVAALGEGVDPAIIEQAGAQAGYPTPPLQLWDELTLTLIRRVRDESRAAALAEGRPWVPHGADTDPVIVPMIDEFERPGRSSGAGFYEYVDGRRTRLWPGLREVFASGSAQVPLIDLQERMLFAEALETVKCFDEGVLRSVPDANIGSLYGIGFPTWTGGVAQYINQYDGGLAGFVARSRELAQRYGDRFTPPQSLVDRAERDEVYA